eukprot:TRINITY_DN7942_c0_g1_i3.p4 TRINITY_DN7942_c0_g1~~TRINITY_DN7942_c0_g1_i3.p4  ORF type:complete len:106 (-),score=6.09 TRINITY_DN7942_c0_g1_i3:1763-2080(-)
MAARRASSASRASRSARYAVKLSASRMLIKTKQQQAYRILRTVSIYEHRSAGTPLSPLALQPRQPAPRESGRSCAAGQQHPLPLPQAARVTGPRRRSQPGESRES